MDSEKWVSTETIEHVANLHSDWSKRMMQLSPRFGTIASQTKQAMTETGKMTDLVKQLTRTGQDWATRFPTVPTDDGGKQQVRSMQPSAIKDCEEASNATRAAGDIFLAILTNLQQLQEELRDKVKPLGDETKEIEREMKTYEEAEMDKMIKDPMYAAFNPFAQMQEAKQKQDWRDEITALYNDATVHFGR